METKSLENAFNKLYQKLEGWIVTLIEMIPNLIIAFIVVLVFNLLGRWISKFGNKALDKISSNLLLNKLIARAFAISFMITGIFFALGLMHLDKTVTSLLAGIGIIGFALSFAFQHTAANFLSGIIITMRSTVNVGDLIKSNGEFGNVFRVGMRSIHILNVTGQHVEIPNRIFIDKPFREYSQTGFRRIDINGKINFYEDLAMIKERAENLMAEFDFIYKDKAPNMVYNVLNKEKVEFTLRVWMNFAKNDGEFLNARSQCIIKLSELFNELNIDIARDEIVYVKQ